MDKLDKIKLELLKSSIPKQLYYDIKISLESGTINREQRAIFNAMARKVDFEKVAKFFYDSDNLEFIYKDDLSDPEEREIVDKLNKLIDGPGIYSIVNLPVASWKNVITDLYEDLNFMHSIVEKYDFETIERMLDFNKKLVADERNYYNQGILFIKKGNLIKFYFDEFVDALFTGEYLDTLTEEEFTNFYLTVFNYPNMIFKVVNEYRDVTNEDGMEKYLELRKKQLNIGNRKLILVSNERIIDGETIRNNLDFIYEKLGTDSSEIAFNKMMQYENRNAVFNDYLFYRDKLWNIRLKNGRYVDEGEFEKIFDDYDNFNGLTIIRNLYFFNKYEEKNIEKLIDQFDNGEYSKYFDDDELLCLGICLALAPMSFIYRDINSNEEKVIDPVTLKEIMDQEIEGATFEEKIDELSLNGVGEYINSGYQQTRKEKYKTKRLPN